jgi:Family of unknown function (DUF5302)
MTKSARQDTSKAAKAAETGPAETASAATQRETSPEPGETAESAAETAATAATAAEGAQETAKPDLDETKRKFREALERKHQAHNEGQGKGGRDDGKIHGAHGPAASRRNFRRKSG